MKLKNFLIVLIFSICISCNRNIEISNTLKFASSDPFQKSISESQYFEIDNIKDNVISGKNGTIIVFPKNCFLDKNGTKVEGNIKIELTESLSLNEMILSNLTTSSNGNLLQTDGMIYFNATKDSEQLKIDKSNPIHIEIPTKKRQDNMSAYKGIRDSVGNMNWIDPKRISNYLKLVDLNSLDFLPTSFLSTLQSKLPYKNHKIASKDLADSLYYLLSVLDGTEFTTGMINTNLNEPYYNKNEVVDGKYTDKSFEINSLFSTSVEVSHSNKKCGIDPAKIKLIKSSKFQYSFIATKEFEARIKTIHQTCDDDILEIYTKNLDKDLYILDSIAEKNTKCHECSHAFYDFYLQKKTKIENQDKYAILLKEYYESEFKKINSELSKVKLDLEKSLALKNEEIKIEVDRYKKLLFKREKFRMETYGFEWSETGWINIDTGTIPKSWGMYPIEVDVKSNIIMDRTYTYLLFPTIKSITRLNSSDNLKFLPGNKFNNQMLLPKNQPAVIISISYKGDKFYQNTKIIETVKDKKILINLNESTKEEFGKLINQFDLNESENKISEDLKYMEIFYKEQKRQKALVKEKEFFQSLRKVAFPCCIKEEDSYEEITIK